ncbi:unnamed protein product, partial [Rotaria socialis]
MEREQKEEEGESSKRAINIGTATASSVTTSSEALMPTTVNNNMKLKNDSIDKILRIRNESLNNPVFSLERYNQTIEFINNAKLRSSARRNDQEISLLKT